MLQNLNNVNSQMQRFADNAVTAAKDKFGVRLDYSENSLLQLELLLQQAHEGYKKVTSSGNSPNIPIENTARIWGSYLGEVIRRKWGGNWLNKNDESIININGFEVSPIFFVSQRVSGQIQYPVNQYFVEISTKIAIVSTNNNQSNPVNQSSERRVKSSISGVINTIVLVLLIMTIAWLWYRVNDLEKRLQTTIATVSNDEIKINVNAANIQTDEENININAANIRADESTISQNAAIYNNFISQFRYSDLRLKDNIGSIPDPLGGILALSGIRFTWNSEGLEQIGAEPGYHYGLIAQNVQKVFPELVQSDTNGYLKVDYVQMIPVLVGAIQEQQAMIVSLQNQLLNKK